MFVSNVNITLFRTRTIISKFLVYNYFMHYHGRVDTVAKRGSMLADLITNKDRRKNWHFNIQSMKPKVRILDGVSRPTRRQAVLNKIFIENITDVLSTGDVAPEMTAYGIEITGVKVSICSRMLNVFWQVRSNHYSCEDIEKILTRATPKLRAELISRNVLGYVPYIFFLRDSTNAKQAEFESAMEKLKLEPQPESAVLIDDSFIKDMFSFKAPKVTKKCKTTHTKTEISNSMSNIKKEISDPDAEKSNSDSVIDDAKEPCPAIYEKPPDMKYDIFGLNHELIMQKVMALKDRKREPTKTAVISSEFLDDDLFDKIPGIRFEVNYDSSRDMILKEFQIERKRLMEKKKAKFDKYGDESVYNTDADIYETELDIFAEDYVEDEIREYAHC